MTTPGTPISDSVVVPPSTVELDGDELRWKPPELPPKGSQPKNIDRTVEPLELLNSFLCLQSDDEIRQWAADFGALQICRHGLPATHNQPALGTETQDRTTPSDEPPRRCRPRSDRGPGVFVEPLATWRSLIDEARGVLILAERLRAGDETPADYDHLRSLIWLADDIEDEGFQAATGIDSALSLPLALPGPDDDPDASADFYLNEIANRWLDLANIRPQIALGPEGQLFQLKATTTFGVLALALAAQLSLVRSGQALPRQAICSNCGRIYTPARKPQAGRRNYCDRHECRVNARARNNQRAYRARQRRNEEPDE